MADYMDDTPEAPEAPTAPGADRGPDGEHEDEQTAVLPREFFGGHDCKPGDEYTVRVVRVHDDSIEVTLESYEEEGEGDYGEEAEGPMGQGGPPAGGDQMAEMMG